MTEKQKKLSPEQRKDVKKQINPAWPRNYYNAILKAKKEYEFVFVSRTAVQFCKKNNIEFWIVFPDYDCKSEYVKRITNRGNKKHFVDNMASNYDDFISQHFKDKNCIKKIVLQKGEYLEDVFKKMNII